MSWKNTILNSEKFTYDYFCIKDVCRLCWCTDGTVELKSFKDSTVAEKILECVSIDTNVFNHPKKLCASCLEEIENFTAFKRFCQESDRNLRKIMMNDDDDDDANKHEKEPEESDMYISNSDTFYDTPILQHSIIREISGNSGQSDSTKESARKKRRIDKENISKTNGKETVELAKMRKQNKLLCYCLPCGLVLESKEYLTKHNLQAHGVTENGHYKCKKTVHKKKLQKLQFVCEICGHISSTKASLEQHILVHTREKPYKCPYCEHRSALSNSITIHVRKHTGERPFPCDMCPHRAATASNLAKHKRCHLGIKDFQCKLCGKKFRAKDGLDYHMGAAHMTRERVKLNTCTECGSSYFRFEHLRRHFFVKHGKKVKRVKDGLLVVPNVVTEGTDDVGSDLDNDYKSS